MAIQTVSQKSTFAVQSGTTQVFGKRGQPLANIDAKFGDEMLRFVNGFYKPSDPKNPKSPKKEAFFATDPIRHKDKAGRVFATTTYTFTPGKPKTDAQGKKVCTGVVKKMYWPNNDDDAFRTYRGVCDIQTGPKHWALQTQEGNRDLNSTPSERIEKGNTLVASNTSAPLSAPLPAFQQTVVTKVQPPKDYQLRSSQVAVDATIGGEKVRFDRQYAKNGQWKPGDQDFLVNTRYVHNPNGVYTGQITYAYTPGINGKPGTIKKTWISASKPDSKATRTFTVGTDNLTSLDKITET